MELERDHSAPNNVNEENGSLEKTSNLDEINLENNGSCANGIRDLGSGEHVEVEKSLNINRKEIEIEKPSDTHSKLTDSPSEFPSVSPPTTKGYGLKKWKRIRRDFNKDGVSGVDFNRILKRGLSGATEPQKTRDPSSEIKQISEGSVASVDSSVRSPGVSGVIKGSSSDSRLAVGPVFPVGTDSENSEDQSSKSSTAASAPKLTYVNPIVTASAWDKSKAKNSSGKISGNSVQRAQLGKGRIETSKKLRGERVKIEKGNSFSSVESDLRSTNIVFPEIGSFSGISNGRDERLSNYNGENNYEAQVSHQQSSTEVRMAYFKDNGGEAEDVSQDDENANLLWEAKEEESDNHWLSTSRDPLVESINLLRAVQEALEKEIQNFGDIGKEPILLPGDSTYNTCLSAEFGSVDSEIYETASSSQLHFKETEKIGSLSPEAELIKLNQKVNFLEKKLEETLNILEVKESRISELEGILSENSLPGGESWSTVQSLPEKCREMETELDYLFKQKVEAEVEYLVITGRTHKLKAATDDQIVILEEPKSLGVEQSQILHEHRNAESNIVVPKKQGEETFGGELLDSEEVLKMHNRVYKHSFCFFIQLILLFLALGLFLLQFLPHFTGIVPT